MLGRCRVLSRWILTGSIKRKGIRKLSNGKSGVDDTQSGGIDRNAILSAALQYVPKTGWSQESIQQAVESFGLPGVAHGLFKQGPGDLIEFYESNCNRDLVKYMETLLSSEQPVKGPQLIQRAVEHRLQMLVPYIDTWHEAMAIKAYPSNMPAALERLAIMFDDIWYHAGDRSTDFNWYTKRGILAVVYCSTELYMIQDHSVDFQDTWNFLHQRFQDTRTITNSRKQIDNIMEETYTITVAGLTTVRNILGVNTWNR